MAKDEDTGIDPVAKDGEVNEGKVADLAQRRSNGGSTAARAAALAAEQEKLDGEDTEAPIDTADDGQMFIWEQGRKVTLGTLIARGTPIEHAIVFGGKRVKGAGALMAFDEDVTAITRWKVAKTSIVPTRDDEERVTKVVIETHVAVRMAPVSVDVEAGVEMMRSFVAAYDERQRKAAAASG